jgi:hypothetical protein
MGMIGSPKTSVSCSGLLGGVGWFKTDVSGVIIGLVFNGKAV